MPVPAYQQRILALSQQTRPAMPPLSAIAPSIPPALARQDNPVTSATQDTLSRTACASRLHPAAISSVRRDSQCVFRQTVICVKLLAAPREAPVSMARASRSTHPCFVKILEANGMIADRDAVQGLVRTPFLEPCALRCAKHSARAPVMLLIGMMPWDASPAAARHAPTLMVASIILSQALLSHARMAT